MRQPALSAARAGVAVLQATFFQNGDTGCTAANWEQSSRPASFAPSALNVSNWIVSMKELGVREAVLTAKHGCGFLLWDTNTTLPGGAPYSYHVPPQLDVLGQFSRAMQAAGLGHGFYYSLTNNMFLNTYGHFVRNGTLLPGQQRVTQAQFERWGRSSNSGSENDLGIAQTNQTR